MPSRRLVVHGVLLLLLVVTASPVALGPRGSSSTPGLKAAIPSPTPPPSATPPPVEATPDGPAGRPSELELGRRGPQAVRNAVAATASGLHALGIQLDLAPVADLRTNPADAVIGDRSFGGDPTLVGPLVAAAVNGLHDGGVGATLKHFPGLGGAAGDPHAAIPTDGESLNQWLATQARTFKAGIDAGVDAVMTT